MRFATTRSSLVTAMALACASVLPAARATAQDASRCRPQTASGWSARCVTDRDGLRDALVGARRTATFADVDTVGEACRVLSGGSGECPSARAQLLTTLLNLSSGRLDGGCCIEVAADRVVTAEQVVRRADEELAGSPSADDCARIARNLSAVNAGTSLTGCDRISRDDRRGDDDAGQGDAHGHEIGRGHFEHGQGKGLGHEKHDHGVTGATGDEFRDRCCDPLAAEAWARRCESRDAATDTRACDALQSGATDDCSRARRERAALQFNVRSGRLAGGCALTNGRTVRDGVERVESLLAAGRCDEAHDLAREMNLGSRLVERTSCGERDFTPRSTRSDDDDRDDDRGRGRSDDLDRGKGKGKGGKGKGKDKD